MLPEACLTSTPARQKSADPWGIFEALYTRSFSLSLCICLDERKFSLLSFRLNASLLANPSRLHSAN